MPLFFARHVHKIDRKGRVSVPATFRAALAGQSFHGIIAFPTFRETYDAIEACGMDRMERLSASLDQLNPFSDAHDDFATAIFGAAVQLPFDGEGRILLPEQLLASAGITDQAAFVGRGATFQIWNPDGHLEFEAGARDRARAARDSLPLNNPDGTGRG